MKKIVTLFFACAVMVSCGGRHMRVEFISSTDLYVGWIDLKSWDFKKFGYAAQADWEKEIAAANGVIKTELAKYLKLYTVTGAAKQWEPQPTKGFIIQFANVTLDPQAALSAYVTIREMPSWRVPGKFTFKVPANTSKDAFAKKLNNACKALAKEIYMNMTQ
ncbi:MAG: hypothetical protein JW807_09315 [Spirochaetes bacterium]|nr:hypothetical protein [Spirochaetota bacterium]